jgi:hypothetical protein
LVDPVYLAREALMTIILFYDFSDNFVIYNNNGSVNMLWMQTSPTLLPIRTQDNKLVAHQGGTIVKAKA